MSLCACGVRFLGTGDTGDCEWSRGCWGPNLGLLQKVCLLTGHFSSSEAKPFMVLQINFCFFCLFFFLLTTYIVYMCDKNQETPLLYFKKCVWLSF